VVIGVFYPPKVENVAGGTTGYGATEGDEECVEFLIRLIKQ
jgi:hypothetical protein